MASKFIQIATSALDSPGQVYIDALDEDGNVWEFQGNGWRRLAMTRIEDKETADAK